MHCSLVMFCSDLAFAKVQIEECLACYLKRSQQSWKVRERKLTHNGNHKHVHIHQLQTRNHSHKHNQKCVQNQTAVTRPVQLTKMQRHMQTAIEIFDHNHIVFPPFVWIVFDNVAKLTCYHLCHSSCGWYFCEEMWKQCPMSRRKNAFIWPLQLILSDLSAEHFEFCFEEWNFKCSQSNHSFVSSFYVYLVSELLISQREKGSWHQH